MEQTELLLFVFFDELFGVMLIPMDMPYIMPVIETMHPNLEYLAKTIAFPARILGAVANYLIGKIISNVFFENIVNMNVSKKFQKIYYVMILAPFDLYGHIVTFLAGFAKMNFKNYLIILIILNLLFFIYRLIW
jgi:membrane protein YqaA with SNARE-associated domain